MTKKVSDITERVSRLEQFVAWGNVEPLPLRELAGTDRWDVYWKHLSLIEEAMIKAQREAIEVQVAIQLALGDGRSSRNI